MFNLSPTDKNTIDDFSYVLESFYLWTDPKDVHVGNACRSLGYWEGDVTQWMMDNIKPGWKCLDIGFNIGYFTEVMSRLVGTDGSVTAFEPNKMLVEKYMEAKKLNDYSNCGKIIVNGFGLSNKDEKINLVIPKDNPGGAGITESMYKSSDGSFSSVEVEVKRLDSVFDEEVDFIKMDIEGHEPLAWEAFPESVKNCNLMVIELGPYHPVEFLEELASKYTMSHINGYKRENGNLVAKCEEDIPVKYILRYPHHLNVVLRRKDV